MVFLDRLRTLMVEVYAVEKAGAGNALALRAVHEVSSRDRSYDLAPGVLLKMPEPRQPS
jgi:hypothetical protein